MLQIAAQIASPRVPALQQQDRLREIIRDWLTRIMDKYGVSQRQLGLRSGVSPATVNRAMDPDGDFVMSTTIMAKISNAFGEAPPSGLMDPALPARQAGLAESDLAVFDADMPELEPEMPLNRGRWRITSEALSLEGYRPGDILEFDMTVHPRPGDVVVAQVYNTHGAQTVLRLFQPPYLVTRSLNPAIDQRPLLIDGDRVMVRGTMVRMFRNRPQ